MAADTKRGAVWIPSEQCGGPYRSDENPASIRKHYAVSLDDLGALLAAQGLHVVTLAEKDELQAARTELGRLHKGKGALPWRTGHRVGRTIYDAHDALLGTLDTVELAALVVQAVNAYEAARG